jgi:hypothetical protein
MITVWPWNPFLILFEVGHDEPKSFLRLSQIRSADISVSVYDFVPQLPQVLQLPSHPGLVCGQLLNLNTGGKSWPARFNRPQPLLHQHLEVDPVPDEVA